LLPLTLIWKLADAPEDPNELKDQLVDFVARNKFDVTVLNERVNRMPLVQASTGQCRLLLAKASAYGWSRDFIQDMAGTNRIAILFRGKIYAEQPVFETLLAHVQSRLLRVIGLVRQPTPVIAVIAQPSCDIESLPWSELRELGTS
jgi:hypothetical protein